MDRNLLLLRIILCFWLCFSRSYGFFKISFMLLGTLIGNLGGNAEIKAVDGREFVTFRVAHNESITNADGTRVEHVQWVDCTMSCDGGRPAILPYLVAGTHVFIVGTMRTRVYSSAKDRCWKAGLTIRVQRIELLGGRTDVVPSRLYDDAGVQHDVTKYYLVGAKSCTMYDSRGNGYDVDKKGWVTAQPTSADGTTDTTNNKTNEPEVF